MAEGGRLELATPLRHAGADPPAPCVLRTYVSSCCGVVASYPAHAPYCDARHAARIWNSAPAQAMRQACAQLQEYVDAEREPDTDEWLLGYAALCRALHVASAGLLAELDQEAGVTP